MGRGTGTTTWLLSPMGESDLAQDARKLRMSSLLPESAAQHRKPSRRTAWMVALRRAFAIWALLHYRDFP